ncbi:ribonuclease Z [Maribacter sp. 2307ULW6-5]|uniref:ribonuclease Z n=1 Tax=Maribacter sp. 2307ULW6-5 TaxID=3386275 RepID=UPI0039BD32BC
MIYDKEGSTTIVYQEKPKITAFVENLAKAYPKLRNDHLILNLFTFKDLVVNDVLEFLELSNTHKRAGKSFVIVTDRFSYDEVPEELTLVPTLQEARDIVEMEEMERDLGL